MPLTLSIQNADRLENGSPLNLVLDQRGAIIGRAATADWSLPDRSLIISSRHCEIRFSEGRYELVDRSTNGTFLLGQQARLPGPHAISPGDVFVIGQFQIHAALDDAAARQASAQQAAPPAWKGWGAPDEAAAAPAANPDRWGAPPVGAAISGDGPLSQRWNSPPAAAPAPAPASAAASGGWGARPVADPAPPPQAFQASPFQTPPHQNPATVPPGQYPVAPHSGSSLGASAGWGAPPQQVPGFAAPPAGPSAWNSAPAPPLQPASDWSSPPPPPAAPGAQDIWGRFDASNVVDWARGGFGQPAHPPFPPPPPAPTPPPAYSPPSAAASSFAAPPPDPGATARPPAAGHGGQAFASAIGIPPDRLRAGENQTLAQAGRLLRQLVAGLVVMLEARTRAKSQLGAQGTSLEFNGNNPLKFARNPDQALEQLLNAPERGFMDGEPAIEDAFRDLQAHQMATLRAMQGALRATLDRFSPNAIRARAETNGVIARVLPAARDAALWAAYEREFSGVAQGSDEAFMDIFAKEFRRAYEEAVHQR